MNDKYYMMDILSTEKTLAVNLVYAMNEASTKKIYNTYATYFKTVSKEVKEIFTLANNLGYYKLEAVPTKNINTTKKELNNELNSL
mgnify:CR=1 FL=1